MVTLIASTFLALAPLQGLPQRAPQANPLIGSVKKAPATAEATHLSQLVEAAGLKKVIQWSPLMTLSPSRTSYAGARLIFYRPACVDAGGIADMMGAPGGWHSEPGDDQSYLLTMFPVSAGKRYGMVFEISRYTEDSGPASYSFEGSGGNKTRNLTGPGFLYYSFVATESGQGGAFLRMASKGRYLFKKVDIKVANL